MFAKKYYTYLYYEPRSFCRRLFYMLCTLVHLMSIFSEKNIDFPCEKIQLIEHMVHSHNLLHSITKTNWNID